MHTRGRLLIGVSITALFLLAKPSMALERTITSSADYNAGESNRVESISHNGQLQLQSDGTWSVRPFKAPELTLIDGNTAAAVTIDGTAYTFLMPGRDTTLLKYSPNENKWVRVSHAPAASFTGARMTSLNGEIYTVFGGYQRNFAKYNPRTNSWTTLTQLPDLIQTGAAMETDGTYIYVLRGLATQDFWRYDPSNNSWSLRASPPATISSGAGMVYNGGNMYVTRGGNTTTLYRYNISSNTWFTTSNLSGNPALPVSPFAIAQNGSVALVGSKFYTLRNSATNAMAYYDISTNIWTTTTTLPNTATQGGLVYNSTENLIYVFRGGTTGDWWKYNPTSDVFVGPADLPQPPGTGADIIYGRNGVMYYRRGSTGNTFHSYTIATNTWATLNVPAALTSTDSKCVWANPTTPSIYCWNGNGTAFYQYTIATNTWSTLAVSPVSANNGSGLAYTGTGDYIYATTGNNSVKFLRYSISGNTWDDAAVADIPTGAEVGIGSRIISNGTDVFLITGTGIPRLLKYTVGTNTWSTIGDLPFAPYYGTDVTYYNGKLYAQAGYYKNEVWEYTIASNTWRYIGQLPSINTYEQGPYNGASLTADTDTGNFYFIIGNSNIRFGQFTPTAYSYPVSGTWTSDVLDLSYVTGWNSLQSSATLPGNSSISFETRSSSNKTSWSAWQSVSGTTIQSPSGRYLQVRATLMSTTDQAQSPILSDITINYSGDSTAPNNPSSVTAYSQQVGGTVIPSSATTTRKYTNPYFTWVSPSDTESSIAGYYVYFGTNSNANPFTDGIFTTSTDFVVTQPLQDNLYYLRIRTKDAAGNISSADSLFEYKYAGVPSSQTSTYTSSSDFTGIANNIVINDNELRLQGADGYWDQERLSLITAATGYGANFAYGDGYLYTFRGANTNSFYRYAISSNGWSGMANAPANINTGGGIIEGPSGYLFGFPGNNLQTFWRYNIDANNWTPMSNVPLTLNYGAAALYDGNDYIYLMRGNSDDAFWRYSISGDSWEALANTDFGAPTSRINNNVYVGGDLAKDSSDILYAIQGNYLTGFSSYNPGTNTWARLPDLPMIPYNGAQIEYDQETNAIYYLPGLATPYLYKYDIGTQVWQRLSDAPDTIRQGGAMRSVNGKLYVLRGNSQTFWKYDIATDSWKKPTVGLFGGEFRNIDIRPFNTGAAIVKGDSNNFYITRGSLDTLFVRYNSATGEVMSRAPLPVALTTDSSFVYVPQENKIYAVGSGINSLYTYDISSDTWAKNTTDLLTANPGAGTSLAYDGSQYIYYVRGAGTTALYRYNRTGSAGARWSTMTVAPGGIGAGSKALYINNALYLAQGNNAANNPFYRYNVGSNNWTTLAPLTGNTVTTGGFAVWDGEDGILSCRGGNSVLCFRYSIASNSWSSLGTPPANISNGGAAATDGMGRMYMIAGTGTNTYANGLYSYVMRTSRTSYVSTGTYESPTHDVGMVYQFAHLSVDYHASSGASLSVETRSSTDGNAWTTWANSSLQSTSQTNRTYRINGTPQRYMQVRFTMTSEGYESGVIDGYQFKLYNDQDNPSNPTSITAYTTATKSAQLVSDTWANKSAPYFEWPQEDVLGGATDTNTGSGVAGYYVYFGTNANANPVTDGNFQTAASFSPSSLESGETYYLRLRTKDNASNTSTDIWQAFIYKYDSEAPTAPTSLTVSPQGYSKTNSYTFSWSSVTHTQSGLGGYCYKTDSPGALETCISEASVSGVLAYTGGGNTFRVRTKDNAGNYSDYKTTTYYYSANAPAAPENLQVQVISSQNNLFSFSWSPPPSGTYFGAEEDIRYYFSINASPSASTIQTSIDSKGGNGLTNTFLGQGEYATLPGWNDFYVVAKDSAGNIDYANWAKISFYAQTSAPGIPRNVDIADLSVKTTSNWRLNVSWDPPVATGSGIKSYKIYRSTNKDAVCSTTMDDFQLIASSQVVATSAAELSKGSAYTDPSLTQQTYAYCVKACNSTDECSAPSGTVSMFPDGKWTEAAEITASPSATVFTRAATIEWSTSRPSNSFVQYGKESGNYKGETGSSVQVTEHSVDLPDLEPGTTYYYIVKWTDEDGNEGKTPEQTFSTAPAPGVKNVKITNVSINSAYVTFTIDHANQAIIQYGKSLAYGSQEEISTSNNESTYTVKLDELTEGTQYNLRIVALDEEDNTYPSDNYVFTTLPVPKVVQMKVQQVVGMPTATLRVLWTTNTDVSSVVTYYPEKNPGATKDFINLTYATSHEAVIQDLRDDTDYVLQIRGRDVAGNEVQPQTTKLKTATDFRPPNIENLEIETTITGVGDEARAKIIVSWDTDEPATTQVEYGPGASGPYQSSTQEDKSLTSNHSVAITGLSPSAIYHVRPVSKDKGDNTAVVNDSVIITPQSTKGALQLVVDNLSKTFGFLKQLEIQQ